MLKKISPEAKERWEQLSEQDQKLWLTGVVCVNCKNPIPADGFSLSIYEDDLALFHECDQCGNKEVRLIDVGAKNQQKVDDDFEQWVKSKRAAHPDLFPGKV